MIRAIGHGLVIMGVGLAAMVILVAGGAAMFVASLAAALAIIWAVIAASINHTAGLMHTGGIALVLFVGIGLVFGLAANGGNPTKPRRRAR